MKLILIFFIFSIFQTVPSSAVPDVEMRITTIEKQMSKRILDLERELIFLKEKDNRAIERLNELDNTVRRQHDEITTLQEHCQKLQRTEESIYSYEVSDSQHVSTIRDDRNGTSEQVVDTDSDKSTTRRKCRYGVIMNDLSLTVYYFYFCKLIHAQYIERYCYNLQPMPKCSIDLGKTVNYNRSINLRFLKRDRDVYFDIGKHT